MGCRRSTQDEDVVEDVVEELAWGAGGAHRMRMWARMRLRTSSYGVQTEHTG